jgi:ribbon-helix-helix CopG family protein
MLKPDPPQVSHDTPIGPEVDIDHDDISLADGTRLTTKTAGQIIEQLRHAAGRPSLTGKAEHSPQVSARVPPELLDAVERYARLVGKTVSQVVREALELLTSTNARAGR